MTTPTRTIPAPRPRRAALALLAGLTAAILWGAPDAAAQPDGPGDPPPPPPMDTPEAPPPDAAPGRRPSPEEARPRLRDFFQRQLDHHRRRQAALEQALRMLDEGKTLDDIRDALPDLPQPGRRGEGRPDDAPFGAPGDRPSRDDRARGQLDNLGDAPLRMGPRDAPRDGRPHNPDAPRGQHPGALDPRPAGPLTAEEREAVREFLRVAAPGILAKLEQLEKTDAPAAERRWQDALPRVRPLIELRARDRAQYDLRLADIRHGREAMESARAVAAAEAASNAADAGLHREKLRDALRAQYRVRTDLLRHDMARAQERLTGMQADLDARSSREESVIDKNVRDLVERESRRLKNKSERGGDRGPRDDRHADGPRGPGQPAPAPRPGRDD